MGNIIHCDCLLVSAQQRYYKAIELLRTTRFPIICQDQVSSHKRHTYDMDYFLTCHWSVNANEKVYQRIIRLLKKCPFDSLAQFQLGMIYAHGIIDDPTKKMYVAMNPQDKLSLYSQPFEHNWGFTLAIHCFHASGNKVALKIADCLGEYEKDRKEKWHTENLQRDKDIWEQQQFLKEYRANEYRKQQEIRKLHPEIEHLERIQTDQKRILANQSDIKTKLNNMPVIYRSY